MHFPKKQPPPPSPRHSLLTYLLPPSKPTDTETALVLPPPTKPLSPISEASDELNTDFWGQRCEDCIYSPPADDEQNWSWKWGVLDMLVGVGYMCVVLLVVMYGDMLVTRFWGNGNGNGVGDGRGGDMEVGSLITLCLTSSTESSAGISRVWVLQNPHVTYVCEEQLVLRVPLSEKMRLVVGDEVVVEELGGFGDDEGVLVGEEGVKDGGKGGGKGVDGPDVGEGMRAGFGGPWRGGRLRFR